jgi:hypothetical protein
MVEVMSYGKTSDQGEVLPLAQLEDSKRVKARRLQCEKPVSSKPPTTTPS